MFLQWISVYIFLPTDGEPAFDQGCYKTLPFTNAIQVSVSEATLTKTTCSEECKQAGYKYAGVKVSTITSLLTLTLL